MSSSSNALQGLERVVVVAVHPMVGRRGVEGFALDGSRLCVMLSRHRSHLTVLVDGQTEAVLSGCGADETVLAAAAVLDRIGRTPRV